MGAADMAMDVVLTTLAFWWAVVGATCIVRALPPFFRWSMQGVKPWACNLCMSFWTGLAFVLGLAATTGAWHTLAAVPALTALGMATLSRLTPPPASVTFPPLEDQA